PQLEHQQTPEPVRVVGAALGVLTEQAFDGARAQLSSASGLVEQEVACELTELAAKPAGDRDAEAGLPPSGDLRWQVAREGSPKRFLTSPASQRLGEGDPELEHLVVEERRAELERMGHRGDVCLQQQIPGQVRLDVELLQACRSGGLRLEG